jgi:hypothetical protein
MFVMWSVEHLPAAADEETALPVHRQARLARMADDDQRQHGFLNLSPDWGKAARRQALGTAYHPGRMALLAIDVSAAGQRVVTVRLRQEDTEDAAV